MGPNKNKLPTKKIPWDWSWGAPTILGLLLFLVYGPSIRFDFVYDDNWTIVKNPAVSSPHPVWKFFIDPTTSAMAGSGIEKDVYRPLSTLSFALNKEWGGLKPNRFHAVNLILYGANVFLLWLLLSGWFSPVPAFIGALFFLVHPLQVESVAWISQRSILICGLGVLLSLWLWQKSQQKKIFSWLAVTAYAFALLGKETAVLLPLLFVALDYLERRKYQPALYVSAGLFFSYFLIRRMVLGHWGQGVERETQVFSSIAEGVSALPLYFRNVFWPVRLNVSYQWISGNVFGGFQFWVGGLILVCILSCLTIYLKKRPLIFIGLGVFIIFWAPHGGVAPLITCAADRFMYLPMAGLAILVAYFAQKLRRPWAFFLALFFLSLISMARVQDWKNEATLWRSSIKADPRNAFAQACYAQAMLFSRDLDAAARHYEIALKEGASTGVARNSLRALILIYQERGDKDHLAFWQKKLDELEAALKKQ